MYSTLKNIFSLSSLDKDYRRIKHYEKVTLFIKVAMDSVNPVTGAMQLRIIIVPTAAFYRRDTDGFYDASNKRNINWHEFLNIYQTEIRNDIY